MKIGPWRIEAALLQRFLAESITKGSALILAFLLARWLAVEGFGAYSQTQALVAVLVPLALLGLGFAIVRQIAGATTTQDIASPIATAFFLVSLTSISIGVVLWFTAVPLAGVFSNHPSAVALIRAAAVLLPVAGWQTLFLEALRARQRVRAATAIQIGEALFALSGVVALLWLDTLTPVTAIALITAVKTVFLIWAVADLFFSQAIRPTQLVLLSPRCIRTALALGIPIMIAGLGEVMMGFVDRLLIGSMAGSDTVGRYVAAQTLIAILASWGAPYWWLLYPRMARALADKAHAEAIATVHRLFGAFILYAAPLAALLAILGPGVLALAIGEEYRMSHAVMAALAAAVFVNQSATPWEYSLYISGRALFLMIASLFWGACALAAIATLVPQMGLLGAAIAVAGARLGFAVTVVLGARQQGMGAVLLPPGLALRTLTALGGGILAAAIAAFITAQAEIAWMSAVLFLVAYGLIAFGVPSLQARRASR